MGVLQEKYQEFKSKFEKGPLVGIDIGLSAVKVALLSHINPKKGKYKLEHYAAVPLSEAAIIEDEIQKPDEILEAISSALEQANISSKIVNLGMDGPNTMTKRLKVPSGSKEEVEDNILWESEQYIPFGAEDSEVDFQVIRELEDEDVIDAIVAAVKIDVVENYMQYVTDLGLNTKAVDLNVFAMTNLFEVVKINEIEAYSEEGVIIIDFGAQTTTVIVYKNDAPVLTKEIPIGGVLITEEIQRQMGLSYEEAEDLKTNGDENGNLPQEIMQIIDNQIIEQMEEIKKVLNFYIAAGSSEQVEYCFITGGGCRLPGLAQAVENVVNCEVSVFNPFETIEYDQKTFDEDSLNHIMTTGVVAMGLGLRAAK